MDPSESLIDRHLVDCALANLRERTIIEKRYSLNRATRAIGKPLLDVTEDDLRSWQVGLLRLSTSARATELSHVARFLQWCVRNRFREDDPTLALIRPRRNHGRKRDPMGEADFGRALAGAPQPERAWLALAGFCGLRCMEIAALERKDVRDTQTPPTLTIHGKGGKDRTVVLPGRVMAELTDAGMPSRGPLWRRADGGIGAPSPKRVSERLNVYLRGIGVSETAHTLRHRFGTELYKESRDPLMVAEQMGHASIDSTRIYVKSDATGAAPHVINISKLHGE